MVLGAMANSDRLHVLRARQWLKRLQEDLEVRDGESPQRLGLSQLFSIYEARLRWDESIGVFDHAIAVLSIENQTSVGPGPQLTSAWLRVLFPGMKPTRVSEWSRVLDALWSYEMDIDEVQCLGIYEAAKRRRLGRAPMIRLGPVPSGRRSKDLRRAVSRKNPE